MPTIVHPVRVLARAFATRCIRAVASVDPSAHQNRATWFWMPDAVSTDCYQCNLKFNLFRRRHHCRICGQIFCQACSGYLIEGRIVGCTSKFG